MKILIIAYDVAPLDLISSQRINHLIDYFLNNGFEVDVLTSKKRPVDGPLLAVERYKELSRKARFIEISSNLKRNYNNDIKDYDLKYTEINPNVRNILKKYRGMLAKQLGQLIDYRTLWAINSLHFLKTSDKGYDVIISSSLPASVTWVGSYAKKINPQALWIADFRDLWSLNHLIEFTFLSKKIDSFLERKFLKDCDLITTVSEDLVKKMQSIHSQEVIMVRNGYIPDEFKNVEPNYEFFLDTNIVNIVYAGNIYRNRRDPTELLDFIINNDLQDRINLHFFGYYLENLLEIIKLKGASKFCFVHRPLPRDKIFNVLKAADINLFLESGDEDAKGVVSGKVFELIAIRRMVLSIGPKSNFESTKLLKESDILLTIRDMKSFVNGNIKSRINSLNNSHKRKITGSRNDQVDNILDFITKNRTE